MAEKKYTQEQLLAMFGNVVSSYESQTGKPFDDEAAHGLADIIAKHEKGIPIGETKSKEDVLYSTKEEAKRIRTYMDGVPSNVLTDFYKIVVDAVLENVNSLNETETIGAAKIALKNIEIGIVGQANNTLSYRIKSSDLVKKLSNNATWTEEESKEIKNKICAILQQYDKKELPLQGMADAINSKTSNFYTTLNNESPRSFPKYANTMQNIVNGMYDTNLKKPKTKENITAANILADIFSYQLELKKVKSVVVQLGSMDY